MEIDIKRIIIILAIIVFILVLSIILIITKSEKKINENTAASPGKKDEEIVIQENIKEVTSRNDYYSVKTCINKYYSYYNEIYNSEYDDSYAKKAVIGMLDEAYIQDKVITESNIKQKLTQINKTIVKIDKMYVKQNNKEMFTYYVTGKIKNQISKESLDFELMVKINMKDRVFSLIPTDYITQKYGNIQNIIDGMIDENIDVTITKNEYNIFDYASITDEQYVQDLLRDYQDDIVYNIDNAYEKLDSDYKKIRFGTIDSFKSYIKDNAKYLIIAQINQYQRTNYTDYNQYVCMDKKGDYYIFKETGIMEYKILLDNHTIDLPQFTEKYNSTRNENKAAMNIEKFKDAINTQDYKYAYEKLDTSFKEKNYPTQESFEEFVKNKLFDRNNFTYTDIEEKNGLYIFKLVVSDLTAKVKENLTLNVVMQLNEGTDFTMSFSID